MWVDIYGKKNKNTETVLSFSPPGDYMLPDAEPEDRVYSEIFSIEEFYKVAEQCLEEYNNTHKNRMNLVIFRYVLEHLSRMCRILRSPGKLILQVSCAPLEPVISALI